MREDVQPTKKKLRIDRTTGRLTGLKLCGLRSENGRIYPRAVLERAIRKYVGSDLFLDHVRNPNDSRSAEDKLGKVRRVWLESDGLYGEAELLTSHPMFERIAEAVEKMPDAYGISHHIEADSETDSDGTVRVVEILRVESCDLVAQPATVRSLGEQRRRRF